MLPQFPPAGRDSRYRSGRCTYWIEIKNPDAPAGSCIKGRGAPPKERPRGVPAWRGALVGTRVVLFTTALFIPPVRGARKRSPLARLVISKGARPQRGLTH